MTQYIVYNYMYLKDLATQNLRSKGSSNFTPDDTGRMSSDGGSFAGGGDEDDIPSVQHTGQIDKNGCYVTLISSLVSS